MHQQETDVASLLMDVEAALRSMDLWQHEPMPAEALASTQPFCIDTMNFPQWLQFVFIVRLRILIDNQQPLPCNCAVAPMAEEYFKGLPINSAVLISHLVSIDKLLT